MPEGIEAVLEQIVEPDAIAAPRAIALAPSNFIFTGEDALRLTVHNSQTGVVVAVHYRQHTPEGDIHASAELFTPSSDRLASASEFAIGRGALLNVTIFASSGAPRRGQTFVRLQVIRGRGQAATVLGTIVQGYITGNQDRAWPGSPLEGSLEGDGYTRLITGTDPAAGGGPYETVPAGARWRLRAAEVALVTSATAVTRRPELHVNPGTGGEIATSWSPGTQGASVGVRYLWSLGMPLAVDIGGDKSVAGLADVRLLAGHSIIITASNLQGGDNFSAPTLYVDEWLEAQ